MKIPSSEMRRRVALVRTDASKERIASMIRETRLGELGTLAGTSNRRKLRRTMKKVISSSET
jgi:DNA-binding MarR family transcriptional regulator